MRRLKRMKCAAASAILGCLAVAVTAKATLPADTYRIYNRHSGFSFAAQGGATANDTSLIQELTLGTSATSEQWKLNAINSTQYDLIGVGSGRAATVASGSTANGAGIILYDYAGATDQKVTATSWTSGFFSLVYVNSGKAISVNGTSTSSGALLVQEANDGNWSTQWRFYPIHRQAYPQTSSSWMPIYLANQNATQSTAHPLIFDGDSITQWWKTNGSSVWNANYVPKNAYDYGIAGDRTENLYWRLLQGEADAQNPKLVVLMIGTNNTPYEDAPTIAGKISDIVTDYLTHCPNAHILLMGILPRGQAPGTSVRTEITAINSQISALNGTGGGRVIYKDIGSLFLNSDGTLNSTLMMSDNLHPTSAGYQVYATAINPIVNQYVP